MDVFYSGNEARAIDLLESSWQQAQDLADSPYRLEQALCPLLEVRLFRRELPAAEQLLERYRDITGQREKPFVTAARRFNR